MRSDSVSEDRSGIRPFDRLGRRTPSAAIDEIGDRLVVLRNYRRLLIAAGRTDEVERIEQRLSPCPMPIRSR
jgi:hypothetical protein